VIAERQTLTGALERVADRRPGVQVPEALYTDVSANVPALMRTVILAVLSQGQLSTAAELCSAVVRLMALQPMRRWLDPQLILRVGLLVHEKEGQNLALLTQVRELVAAQGRWHAAALRHGTQVDAGDPGDWGLLREMNALSLDFPPKLRGLIARGVIRQDLMAARAQLASFSRESPGVADMARRQLNRYAPELSSLFGAELAPTRPMVSLNVQLQRPTLDDLPSAGRVKDLIVGMVWPVCMVMATLAVVALLLTRPSAAHSQREAVDTICQLVGADHPSCLTASALGTGLDLGDCGMATQALPVLADQLSNYGLNREFAVIRTDSLGEFRVPFDALEYSFASICP
jgi:hypothetical protein